MQSLSEREKVKYAPIPFISVWACHRCIHFDRSKGKVGACILNNHSGLRKSCQDFKSKIRLGIFNTFTLP